MDFQAILDQMGEIVYVSDQATYELKYLNQTGIQRFGTPTPRTKCYAHLCGRTSPCKFCARDQAASCQKQRQAWLRERPDLGNVLLSHSLIEYEGRPCRLGTVMDVDRYVAELTTVKNDLIAAKMLISCMEQMVSGGDAKCVMDTVRAYYDADRAYVLRFAADRRTAGVILEVCREDVVSQQELMQDVPMELLKPMLSALQPSNQRTVCVIADVDAIKDDPARRAVYDWLHPQGIHSLIAVPVYHGSELHGFLCAENLRQNIDAPELMEKIAYMAAGELHRRLLMQELHQKAYYAPLTMCYNRIAYDEALDRLCGTEQPTGIGCLNLNGLRRINECLGYHYGDKAIYQACSLLKGCFGYKNVYRVSGDEYMVLWPGVSYENFTAACRRLETELETAGGFASFGRSWGTKEKVNDLIKEAEGSMYTMKNRYYATMEQRERPAYIDKILKEYRESKFVGYLQPLYSIQADKIYGAEVLVRKVDPFGGVHFPRDFISAMETYGMISMVDLEMFRQACELTARWKSIWPDLILNVNFSRATLGEPDCMERVDEILRDTGADPKQIIAEVTEGSQGMQREVMEARLSAFKSRGFSIALDDMGTEAACLETLFLPQLDIIKIDRSLISRAEHGERERTVVAGLIELGHRLGMNCVAEGIEQETQMELLKRLHCDRLQGYYIGKPMPPEEYFKRFAPVERLTGTNDSRT